MAGVPSMAIRFICHIPTGMTGVDGLSLYSDAKGLDSSVFDDIPNGHAFLHGLQIVGQAGIATFAWNFVMFLGSLACAGPGLVVLGLIDLSLAAALTVGVAYQRSFLPATYGACDDAIDWKNGTNGRNFFLVANQSSSFSGDYSSPHDIRYAYVENTIVAVVVIAFYIFCAVLNLLIGIVQSHDIFGTDVDGEVCCAPCIWSFRGLCWLLKPVFYVMDHIVASCRFSTRYGAKCMAGSIAETIGS